MDLSQETEDYIRESIEHTLGLPISEHTLRLKLRASEEERHNLRNRYLLLQSKLKEKDEIIDRARAEASMNAQALKKFVDENQKLALECANLLAQCKKWEKECSLYDHDREALMDFGNEADERAKEAEIRVHELEEEVKKLSEELEFYEYQSEAKLPSTQEERELLAEVKRLENEKEHLRVNLHRAEEEVKVLFEENNFLDTENKRLMKKLKLHREKHTPGSDGKHSSSSPTKGNKRKSTPIISSQVEKKIDFWDGDYLRQPLSPLQHHSPEARMHKK